MHFGFVQAFDFVELVSFMRDYKGRLPNYKNLFQLAARTYVEDWKLLAAIAYQESRWDPNAVSATGVKGMMMLTKHTAEEMNIADREDPAQSIAGGTKSVDTKTMEFRPNHELPLQTIKLPDGFKIDVYNIDVPNARQMALSDNGTLFVGTRKQGLVYALQDKDGDNYAETRYVIAKDLRMPSGLVFHDGDLYVGAVSRILRFDDIEKNLVEPPKPVVVSDKFPSDGHHGWKYLGLGPDNKLYVPVGAPCNVCDDAGYAEIQRMNLDGSEIETYAQGVRNSVGLAWHPVSQELWFTDNGRDQMGDDLPDCELNHAPKAGLHFGFPYCHQGDILDPKFGEGKSCTDYVKPELNLGPHVAPLGLDFYTGEAFPDEYKNNAFVAEHGSWNRSEKIGYRVKRIEFDDKHQATQQNVFAQGWLSDDKKEVWGRPNDVLTLPDGSILISDDHAGAIYRVTYTK